VVAPEIDPARMQPMRALRYPSFDGTSIPAYLTLPGKPAGPAPLIVLIHGGPQARDRWSFDRDVQVFAAHGYAVFQPQFRGSTGFGKKFQEAGYGQWGQAMQDDITAGVHWLIDQQIADPPRICIVGASYGGYAALWGLEKTPELRFQSANDLAFALETLATGSATVSTGGGAQAEEGVVLRGGWVTLDGMKSMTDPTTTLADLKTRVLTFARERDWEQFHAPVDRIVSIEAFEHFGFESYDDFFKTCFDILPADGRMTIQSSVSYHPYDLTARGKKLTFELARFIKFMITEIFPGGRIPTTQMMVEHGEKAGFVVPEPLSLRNHYIKTLGIWASRLEQNKEAAIAATDEENYRRYMRYLTGCQYYFIDESIDVSLVTYLKPGAAA